MFPSYVEEVRRNDAGSVAAVIVSDGMSGNFVAERRNVTNLSAGIHRNKR